MYRVGIVGVGGVAVKHYTAVSRSPDFTLCGITDVNPQLLGDRAKEWQVRPYPDAKSLIESDVDLVVICTPPRVRSELIGLAARAGRHILCEKPLALDVEEGRHIIDVVQRAGIIFMVGFNPLYWPAYRTAVEIYRSGRLGRLVSVRLKQHVFRTAPQWAELLRGHSWRASIQESGGRIQEYGSHALSWLLKLGGAPLSVMGRAWTVSRGLSVDDSDVAFITFAGGATAYYELFMAPVVETGSGFTIIGTDGSITYRDGDKSLRLISYTDDPAPISEEVELRSTPTQYEDLERALREGVQPEENASAAFDTLAVCEAFAASAARGEAVPVSRSDISLK